jgi:NAD(P)H-flavin reductase
LVVVKAPLAARMFKPGQFYRLQNYEANALTTDHRPLTTDFRHVFGIAPGA